MTGDATLARTAHGPLLDVALSTFAAGDGGFFDTADDARAAARRRPRDPSDNASPSGQSALVHALLAYAALTGSGRHRDAAEAALRYVRTLAEQVPRFAGWSLAAAEALLAGPLEVAVVGADGDPARDELARVARGSASPGLVVVVGEPSDAEPGETDDPGRCRCSPVVAWSTGAPRRTSAGAWCATGRSPSRPTSRRCCDAEAQRREYVAIDTPT